MRILLVATVAASFAFGGRSDKESMKAALMNADRAFAKATAERRLDGWMEFYTEDAVRITPLGGKATIGRKAIRELDKNLFADADTRLIWEPTDGGAYPDGRIGFTTGKAKILTKDDNVMFEGAYVTLWRKEADGWKVILDTGASTKHEKD
jgi:ketosteroid isomerase-like protein